MAQDGPLPIEQLRALPGQLETFFSLEELREMAFELRLDPENIPDETKSAFARELVLALNRELRLPELLKLLKSRRAGVDWALDDVDRPAEPPYRGLEFFREQDAGLFFGRDRLAAELIRRLKSHPFLAVIGASGSGKSSLVRAGVVPALKRGKKLADGRTPPAGSAGWAYLTVTPTEHPLERLAVALTSDLPGAAGTAVLGADLRVAADHLRLATGKYLDRAGKPRLFLLVDQFEEVFTACKDEDERRAFIDGLFAATNGEATVVITLRADFYHRCDPYPALRAALEHHQTYIGAPDREELRAAIVEPATRRGYALEEGLADLMLRDAGDEPGLLPLLSHALLETWRRREGRMMTLDGYNRAGGVRGAIAHTAEEVFSELRGENQQTMERIFIELTELGEGAEDTRRRVARVELAGHPWYRDDGEQLLERLVGARLATADGDAVQIAHEALIREWPRLREWLAADRQGERLRRDLAEAARDWEANNQDESYLIEGARLAAAREWAAANAGRLDERSAAFLSASVERQEREAREKAAAEDRRLRLTRRFLYVAGALALLAVAAAIYALNRSGEAQRQAVRAENSLATATVALGSADEARETAEFEAARALRAEGVAGDNLTTAMAALATSEAETGRADRNAAEAAARAAEAQSRQLVAEAAALDGSQMMRATLLSIEAGRIADTVASLSSVHRLTGYLPRRLLSATLDSWPYGANWNDDATQFLTWNDENATVLDAITTERILTLAHADDVHGAAWNADESRILTWSKDGTANVWDVATGERLIELVHNGWVVSAVWNAGESRILTTSNDGMVAVWDASTGAKLLNLGHGDQVLGGAWNNDESRILTWGNDGTAAVWNADTGERLLTISQESLDSAKWSHDGSLILTLSRRIDLLTGEVTIWNAITGEKILDLHQGDWPNGAVWNDDDSRILTWMGSSRGAAVVWDTTNGERILTLPHDMPVNGATWSADESRILTWGGFLSPSSGTATVWDAVSGTRLLSLTHAGEVNGAAWDENERYILTSSWDGTAAVWDSNTGELVYSLTHDSYVSNAAWNSDGSLILTVSGDEDAMIWDVSEDSRFLHSNEYVPSQQEIENMSGSRNLTWNDERTITVMDTDSGAELYSLTQGGSYILGAWNGDGSRILTWSGDLESDVGSAAIWDADSGTRLLEFVDENGVFGAAWSVDGSRILTHNGQAVKIWDAASGERLHLLEPEGYTFGAVWNRDGNHILSWNETEDMAGSVIIWNSNSGKPALTLMHRRAVNGAALNTDESRILSWSADKTAVIWDATNGQRLQTFVHQAPVFGADWNDDENRVLTWTNDGMATLWDAGSGERLQFFEGDGTQILSAAWNDDESEIMITTILGRVFRYYTRTDDLLAAACERVTRNLTWDEWQLYLPGEPYRCTCPNRPIHPSVLEAPDVVVDEAAVCAAG